MYMQALVNNLANVVFSEEDVSSCEVSMDKLLAREVLHPQCYLGAEVEQSLGEISGNYFSLAAAEAKGILISTH